jgi:DNA-binding CsgD family transcriptional regulator
MSSFGAILDKITENSLYVSAETIKKYSSLKSDGITEKITIPKVSAETIRKYSSLRIKLPKLPKLPKLRFLKIKIFRIRRSFKVKVKRKPGRPKLLVRTKTIRPRRFQTTYKFMLPVKHTKEYKLTKEEKTLLPLLPCPNSHIAILLGIGIKAVEKTIASLLCKFEASSRQELIVIATKKQIIDIEDYVLPPKSYNRRP